MGRAQCHPLRDIQDRSHAFLTPEKALASRSRKAIRGRGPDSPPRPGCGPMVEDVARPCPHTQREPARLRQPRQTGRSQDPSPSTKYGAPQPHHPGSHALRGRDHLERRKGIEGGRQASINRMRIAVLTALQSAPLGIVVGESAGPGKSPAAGPPAGTLCLATGGPTLGRGRARAALRDDGQDPGDGRTETWERQEWGRLRTFPGDLLVVADDEDKAPETSKRWKAGARTNWMTEVLGRRWCGGRKPTTRNPGGRQERQQGWTLSSETSIPPRKKTSESSTQRCSQSTAR